MKHLIHKNHHPHLKKRAILEFFGFIMLAGFIVLQKEVIAESITTVLNVDILWFIFILATYWLMLPLTAISYRLISPKPSKINLRTTILAHLAGAGPGRIIPGGVGNISIASMHLKKSGLSIEQAIGVVLTNNILGLITNLLLLISVLLVRPDIFSTLATSVSGKQIIFVIFLIILLLVIRQWLVHAHGTKNELMRVFIAWKKVAKQFLISKKRVFSVIFVAALVAILHTIILEFSANALDTSLGFTDALIALSFGVVAGNVLPTPGGVGGVEAGIAATLVILGYDTATATSIAVLFRIATYWQPLLPGTLSYLYLREHKLL